MGAAVAVDVVVIIIIIDMLVEWQKMVEKKVKKAVWR
jgi:hypothetical protein